MTFRADPAAIREYARQLGDAERVAEEADRYITTHGLSASRRAGSSP
jgi:hypothetical protein